MPGELLKFLITPTHFVTSADAQSILLLVTFYCPLVHARKNGLVTQAESPSNTDDGNIDAFTGNNREYKPDIVASHSSHPEIRSRVHKYATLDRELRGLDRDKYRR